jgi:hypothetical protein
MDLLASAQFLSSVITIACSGSTVLSLSLLYSHLPCFFWHPMSPSEAARLATENPPDVSQSQIKRVWFLLPKKQMCWSLADLKSF